MFQSKEVELNKLLRNSPENDEMTQREPINKNTTTDNYQHETKLHTFTEFCKMRTNKSYQLHIKGKKHQKNEKKLRQVSTTKQEKDVDKKSYIDTGSAKTGYCDICGQHWRDYVGAYEKHIKGKKHRKKERQLHEINRLRKPMAISNQGTQRHCSMCLTLKQQYTKQTRQMTQQITYLNDMLLQYSQQMEYYKKQCNKLQNEIDNSNNMNVHGNNLYDLCEQKFEYWLCHIVKLEQYLSVFKQNEYNDISMVEFIDENVITNELRISKKLHIQLLLSRVEEFKHMRQEFDLLLSNHVTLKDFRRNLRGNGILTIHDLKQDVKTDEDVKRIFETNDKQRLHQILHIIHSEI